MLLYTGSSPIAGLASRCHVIQVKSDNGKLLYWGHKQTDLIIMDFAKAFDKVPHRRLLHKLDYYGIRGSTHKWISSWLSGRSQQVVLDGQSSDPVPVLPGVPQGSVLVLNPITVYSYGFLFNCMTVGQSSGYMTALT